MPTTPRITPNTFHAAPHAPARRALLAGSGTLLQVSNMLRPFMPQTAERIHDMFASGVVPSQLTPLFPRLYLHTPNPRTPKAETQGK